MVVLERLDGHLLLDPVGLVAGGRREKREAVGVDLVRVRLRGQVEGLLPAGPRVVVESRRAPVEVSLRALRLDLQHRRLLLREVDPEVVRVPDVADADGVVGLVVRIPALPGEERALGDGAGCRRDRRDHDQHERDREPLRETPRGMRAAPEQEEHRQHADQSERADEERARARHEGRRPPHADDEDDGGADRPPGGDQDPRGEREPEDREQHVRMHEREVAAAERERRVVEVEEAVPERPEHGAEEVVLATRAGIR